MTDVLTKAQRKKNMSAIKSISKIESRFAKALWHNGIRYRRNVKSLYGTPDIAIKKYKIVIFVDSCFWHACPVHFTRPKSNEDFWDSKIHKNRERDLKVTEYYLSRGWNIKRIWEHSIKNDFDETIEQTLLFIREAKNINH